MRQKESLEQQNGRQICLKLLVVFLFIFVSVSQRATFLVWHARTPPSCKTTGFEPPSLEKTEHYQIQHLKDAVSPQEIYYAINKVIGTIGTIKKHHSKMAGSM